MHYRSFYNHRLYEQFKKVVLFCNQAAFDHEAKIYLFDLLIQDNKLLRILQPEHGLFAAIQDQDNIENEHYKGIPCASMYDKQKDITGPSHIMLEGADTLVIDIQDAGVRYFTYTTHMFALLSFAIHHFPNIQIVVMDRPNPAGTKIEGTPLPTVYQSFLGSEDMIHRHGLSTRQLCAWYLKKQKLETNILYIPVPTCTQNHQYISPSPNIPVLESLHIYAGQCFWEATTFSEGRGTTRPFTLFGHPELLPKDADRIADRFNNQWKDLAYLRPTKFIPVFHKHSQQVCTGWQLHIEDAANFHSILGTLWIMREVHRSWNGVNFWRSGPYEFDSSCTAAELLIGDDDLMNYVNGKIPMEPIVQKLTTSEDLWRMERDLYLT